MNFCFQVEYMTMPGWQTTTENVREFRDLPENAKNYVRQIEKILDVPGKFVRSNRYNNHLHYSNKVTFISLYASRNS